MVTKANIPVAKTSFNLRQPTEVMAEDSDPEEGKALNRDRIENDGSGRLANAAAILDMKMSKGVNKAK